MSITSVINLQQFCGREWPRPWLGKPFRFGNESIATNGHILVKVPARDGDAPPDKAPKTLDGYLTKIFERAPDLTYSPAPPVTLPPEEAPKVVECDDCDGRGYDHDCPECTCTCDACAGSGKQIVEEKVSTNFCGGLFRLDYVRQVVSLPDLKLAVGSSDFNKSVPLLFKFDGGEGALMPLRNKYETHVEVENGVIAKAKASA